MNQVVRKSKFLSCIHNKVTDQPEHLYSLICAFDVSCITITHLHVCNMLQFFTAVNKIFQIKIFCYFLIFAQNIDCRYKF